MATRSEVTRAYPAGSQPAGSQPMLRVEIAEPYPGAVVVAPIGEVDVASRDLLRETAREAVATARRCVVIDLTGLTFCGSTGMVELLGARRRAVAAGVRFGTAGGPPIVRRVLEITQLGPVLGHRDTLDEALRELA